MTKREKEIVSHLRENPLVSQEELAEILGISRSSVGVHIGNLMKKGIVKGKGYILQDEIRTLIIGGANIDLEGFPLNPLRLNDSNPGSIRTTYGGVGRNIAENLSRVGVEVGLITSVGNDDYGRKIIDHAHNIGIDTDLVERSNSHPTSAYVAILDENHDMKVAISQMDVMRELTPERIMRKLSILNKAPLLCIDGNLREDTIEFLVKQLKSTPVFVDPVSTTYAKKFSGVLHLIHTIKPNKSEAEQLLDIRIRTKNDLQSAGRMFIKHGVKQVFISLGDKGVYFKTLKVEGIVKGTPRKIISVTGAGDGFMAGLINGFIKNWQINKTVCFAQGISHVNMLSPFTIHPELSAELVEKEMKISKVTIEFLKEEDNNEEI